LEIVLGEKKLPDELSPYVFETARTPDVSSLTDSLNRGVDFFLVEVSDGRQFRYGDVVFQQNFFTRRFVRPYGDALLPWFRHVSRGRPMDEDRVNEALERLREAGFAPDETTSDFLRRVRLERSDAEETSGALARMMAKVGGRWIVVGALTLPDVPGAVMDDRRTLNDNLRQACSAQGALFYDPSELIAEHGRSVVLDSGGANIYEYARSFYPTVGQTLLNLIRQVRQPPDRSRALTLEPASWTAPSLSHRLRSSRAERINAELVALHAGRLAALGTVESGLYSHYERLIDQAALIGTRERAALTLIERHLPEYGAYAVIRAGLGEMAFLIAASGRRVTAYEPSARRRQAIEAGLDHLQMAGLIEPGAMTLVDALTPVARMTGRVLGVALDASEVRDDAAAAPHLSRAGGLAGLLIDPRRFIRLRQTIPEQESLLRDLEAMGFDGRRDYCDDRLIWLHRSS
jgi:hypothetical protein